MLPALFPKDTPIFFLVFFETIQGTYSRNILLASGVFGKGCCGCCCFCCRCNCCYHWRNSCLLCSVAALLAGTLPKERNVTAEKAGNLSNLEERPPGNVFSERGNRSESAITCVRRVALGWALNVPPSLARRDLKTHSDRLNCGITDPYIGAVNTAMPIRYKPYKVAVKVHDCIII